MDKLLLWVMIFGLATLSWSHLEVIHSWKTIDFVFPNNTLRESMITNGQFIPKNNFPLDVDLWETGNGHKKIFVTIPKFKDGVPATLATVQSDGRLKPYPDWSWFTDTSYQLTSVFRIQVDDCGRLWVLDSGTTNILSKPKHISQPQILLFDPRTDDLIGRYNFPDDVIDSKSTLVTIAVDTRGEYCQDTFVYIADVVSYKIIVFDANQGRSWKVSSNLFYPYPFHGRFHISGVNFDLMDGILGLALGPLDDGDRTLYWHSLASVRESWVKTSVIRNNSLFPNGSNHSPELFMVSYDERMSQSGPEVMSTEGILFFGLLSENAIACWNSKYPYTPNNIQILEKDDSTLQFLSGIKIRNGKLYMMTNRFQNVMVGNVSEKEENYRILVGDIDEMTSSTLCKTKAKQQIKQNFGERLSAYFSNENRIESSKVMLPWQQKPNTPNFGNKIVFSE